MSKSIKSYRILLFLAIVVAVLALLCVLMPSDGVNLFGKTLRFPSLKRIMEPKEKFDMEAFLAEEQRRQDSIAKIEQDSINYYVSLLSDSATRFYFPNDDYSFFDNVFATMDSAQQQQRTVRVLHYGDSQIEMDHITDRLRHCLQSQFGGGGPGLLPLEGFTPITAAQVWAEGSFQKLSSFGDSTVVRSSGNYGPMMQCCRIVGGASSGLRPTARKEASELLSCFNKISLLINNREGQFLARIKVAPMGMTDSREISASGVQRLDWQLDSCISRINFSYSGVADIYGIMADNGYGVAVDNIPMRGCSGHQFKMVNQTLLTDAYRAMDVTLIILQFGGNSVPYITGQKGLDRYCEELGEQIDYIRTCCPDATILFIGPSDMTTSGNGSWQTYPFLPQFIAGLRNMAVQHGAAYWSIYNAMGGWNSMKSWVEKGYAGKDYMHFSQRGADVMGDRLAEAFMKVYRFYRFRHKQPVTSFTDTIQPQQ